jgi:hypothetical protein
LIVIVVILKTFCLGSYLKGLLTFIGNFVILTTFNVDRMTKIPINVSRHLKYDPKQNVVRMTKYL